MLLYVAEKQQIFFSVQLKSEFLQLSSSVQLRRGRYFSQCRVQKWNFRYLSQCRVQKSFIMLHRQNTMNSVQAFSTKHITEGPRVMRILGPGKVTLRKIFVSGIKSQLVGSNPTYAQSPIYKKSPSNESFIALQKWYTLQIFSM